MIASIELAPDRQAPVACRRWLQSHLAGDDPVLVDDVVLLASELVTNVVLYARTPLVVSLRADEQGIRVEVCDESPALPAQRRYGTDAASGRGLALLERLASRWGAEPLPGGAGKAVWFRLERQPVAAGDPGPELGWLPETSGEVSRTYHFIGTPIDVVNRAWEEYGDFLRELRLGHDDEVDWSDYEAAEAVSPDLRIFYRVRQQALAAAEAPSGDPADAVDLALVLDARAGEAAAHLTAFFECAEETYRGEGRLLAPLPGRPSVALRRWLLGEVVNQSRGEEPRSWSEVATPRRRHADS